jgi:hypothetical protein
MCRTWCCKTSKYSTYIRKRIEIGVLAAGCGARRGQDVPRLKRGGRGVRVVGVVTPSGPGPKTIGSRSTPKNGRFNYLRICIVQEKN